MKRDIRFMVTNYCNYGCYFCHNEGMVRNAFRHDLKPEDYAFIFKIYRDLEEWNGVTISGGEPLMHIAIDDIVEHLYNAGAEITIVTNGSLISEHLLMFKYVKRINISIHTLSEDMYESITRRRHNFRKVLDNLDTIRGLYPDIEIRLNATPCKSNGWDEVQLRELIAFSKRINATIKLTELFPNTDTDNCVSIEELRETLLRLGYTEVPNDARAIKLKNSENHHIYLTQCTVPKR